MLPAFHKIKKRDRVMNNRVAKRQSSKQRRVTKRTPFVPPLFSDELVRDAEAPTHGNHVLWRIERLLVDIRDELRLKRPRKPAHWAI